MYVLYLFMVICIYVLVCVYHVFLYNYIKRREEHWRTHIQGCRLGLLQDSWSDMSKVRVGGEQRQKEAKSKKKRYKKLQKKGGGTSLMAQ